MNLDATFILDHIAAISTKSVTSTGKEDPLQTISFGSLLSQIATPGSSSHAESLVTDSASAAQFALVPPSLARANVLDADLRDKVGASVHPEDSKLADFELQLLQKLSAIPEIQNGTGSAIPNLQNGTGIVSDEVIGEAHAEIEKVVNLFQELGISRQDTGRLIQAARDNGLGPADILLVLRTEVAIKQNGDLHPSPERISGLDKEQQSLLTLVHQITETSPIQPDHSSQTSRQVTSPGLLLSGLQPPTSETPVTVDSGLIQTLASGGNQLSEIVQKLLNTQGSTELHEWSSVDGDVTDTVKLTANGSKDSGSGLQSQTVSAKANADILASSSHSSGQNFNQNNESLLKTPLIKSLLSKSNGEPLTVIQEKPQGDVVVAGQSSNAAIQLGAVASSQTQAPSIPVNAMAVHIAKQVQNGLRRFDIRLDPPELGRVHVRLDVSKDGLVNTHLVVERAETLDMFQRDARTLERALANAGLDVGKDGLSFALKDQGHSNERFFAHTNDGQPFDNQIGEGEGESTAPETVQEQNFYVSRSGIDIRV